MAKLVEILARELKEWHNSWPALGQASDGSLHREPFLGGNTNFCLTLADDYLGAIVTRAEWQAAVDALKAKEVVAWDGVGLPPVGTICENVFPGEIWREVIIIAHDEDMAVFRLNNSERLNYFGDAKQHFRPIRTPEQIEKARREAEANELLKGFIEYRDSNPSHGSTARVMIEYMQAIGYRKQEPK